MLAPRRRKAVNYNEAKLHRKYVTDSESEATAAEVGSDDPDDSNAEDGPQNKVNGCLADLQPRTEALFVTEPRPMVAQSAICANMQADVSATVLLLSESCTYLMQQQLLYECIAQAGLSATPSHSCSTCIQLSQT